LAKPRSPATDGFLLDKLRKRAEIPPTQKGSKMTKPKNFSDAPDFDPAAVLRRIAADEAAPAGARAAAARTLLVAASKAAKPTPEKVASQIDRAALRLIAGKRRA
jgi:hypothetical protein